MKCAEIDDRLDDYVDGLLEEREFQEVEGHLLDCPACRANERLLRALLTHASALPKEMAPPRDLWEGIASRIEDRSGKGSFWGPLKRHRVALLATAATVLLALLLVREHPWGLSTTSSPQGTSRFVSDADPGRIAEAEAEYVRATATLMKALTERPEALKPETLMAINDNLGVIDSALNEVRSAIRKDPTNPQLVHMLTAMHRKKVDVLMQVMRLRTQL